MVTSEAVTGEDGMPRCPWPGIAIADYAAYHDEEWGREVHGEQPLLERLCLEAFQSGLSWLTILRKRPAFRAAFRGFDPEVVAAFGDQDVERLLGDAGIVRNRRKIEATIANARATLALRDHGGLDLLLWSHRPASPPGSPPRPRPRRLSDVPASTPQSVTLTTALKAAGFRHLGPTTAYAAMQACGLVDDHVVGCHRAEP